MLLYHLLRACLCVGVLGDSAGNTVANVFVPRFRIDFLNTFIKQTSMDQSSVRESRELENDGDIGTQSSTVGNSIDYGSPQKNAKSDHKTAGGRRQKNGKSGNGNADDGPQDDAKFGNTIKGGSPQKNAKSGNKIAAHDSPQKDAKSDDETTDDNPQEDDAAKEDGMSDSKTPPISNAAIRNKGDMPAKGAETQNELNRESLEGNDPWTLTAKAEAKLTGSDHHRAYVPTNQTTVRAGYGTYYTPNLWSSRCRTLQEGACGWVNYEAQYIAALNVRDEDKYGLKSWCGKCLSVQAPEAPAEYQGRSVTAMIVDKCPFWNCTHNDVDMSPAVFERLHPCGPGRIKILWHVVDCPATGMEDYMTTVTDVSKTHYNWVDPTCDKSFPHTKPQVLCKPKALPTSKRINNLALKMSFIGLSLDCKWFE
ncbi:hypothetical protein RI367_007129 [Sorochytrium milnesiophthora]